MNKNLILKFSVIFFISTSIDGSELNEDWFKPAGITSSSKFRLFYSELVEDVVTKNSAAIATKISFPIIVNGEIPFKIKNTMQFIEKYELIFNLKVQRAIINQKFEDIRRRSNGAMIGNGVLWITGLKRKDELSFTIKIYAINN